MHAVPRAKVFLRLCVVIEGDGVHCEGRHPPPPTPNPPTPMYAVMWLCCAARRLVETGPFCCFPRGGWPWRLEPAEWVPGGCRGVFVAVSVIEKDQDLISWPNLLFFSVCFLAFETFLLAHFIQPNRQQS